MTCRSSPPAEGLGNRVVFFFKLVIDTLQSQCSVGKKERRMDIGKAGSSFHHGNVLLLFSRQLQFMVLISLTKVVLRVFCISGMFAVLFWLEGIFIYVVNICIALWSENEVTVVPVTSTGQDCSAESTGSVPAGELRFANCVEQPKKKKKK